MANMGYCRFQNTLRDLRDCEDHLYDDDLDEKEQFARKHLIRICIRINRAMDVMRYGKLGPSTKLKTGGIMKTKGSKVIKC